MSRIAVVGATGPTGLLVVGEALSRGHEVVAYVRNPRSIDARPNLTIIEGQLHQRAEFAQALAGCEVVISTLGTHSLKERTFMSTHLPLVTNAMVDAGVSRLVLMSALGGGEVPAHTRGLDRLIFNFLSSVVFADRTRSESALAKSGIAWAAVYPGFLSDGAADVLQTADLTRVTKVSQERVPRANVAKVLVDLAEDSSSSGRRLAIAKSISTN